MPTIYPAHIHPENKNITQSCSEHSRNAAMYAGNSLKSVKLYSSAYLAGLMHDMGKFKDQFKEYIEAFANGILQRRGSVIHTFAGVRNLLKYHSTEAGITYKNSAIEILAYAAGAHHGLFDIVNENNENGFLHRLEKIPAGDNEAVNNFHEQCADTKELQALFESAVDELISVMKKCADISGNSDETMFMRGLIIRLLTSAVMEGDRRDTAKFMNGAVFPESAGTALWQSLLEKVESKLNKLPADTPIDKARRKISDICRETAEKPSGIYRLNVPTGGGKTLSALRYALAHAAKYNKKRIIFTFPLLSILDQNSSVIQNYIENKSIVLEHHSNVVQENNSKEELERYELLTDSWSSPIIITTLVQLLNTMFDGKTSSVRRFHALTDAVIVIDEVQTVPNKMLTLFNLTISFLAQLCGTTILLCSATQPCLEAAAHPVRAKIEDIVPHDYIDWKIFKRTYICFAGSYQINELPAFASKILEKTSNLLIVCNKKAESEAIFNAMQNGEDNLFHLSAAMCMKHRKKTLKNIFESLKGSKKTVCVATQVVEAGVDISFDAVIRLTAGMDSIIQSAGRCNRNGKSDTVCPVYIVRLLDENLTNLPDIKVAQEATEQLLNEYNISSDSCDIDLESDEVIRYYYQYLYSIQCHNNEDCHDYPTKGKTTLFNLLSENDNYFRDNKKKQSIYFYFQQAFATAGKLFEVFDSCTTDVIVSWGEGENIIANLSSERAKHDMGYVKEWLDKAREYTVSLYSYQKKKLEECGAIIPLADGAILGLAPEYYNSSIGVQINTSKEEQNECNTLIW